MEGQSDITKQQKKEVMELVSEIARERIAPQAAEFDRSGDFPDDSPATAALNGFKVKLYASEMAVDVTNKAIQVHGGHGYSRDYIVERLFRDARGLTLHFKTSEWLRHDIAKAALGL